VPVPVGSPVALLVEVGPDLVVLVGPLPLDLDPVELLVAAVGNPVAVGAGLVGLATPGSETADRGSGSGPARLLIEAVNAAASPRPATSSTGTAKNGLIIRPPPCA